MISQKMLLALLTVSFITASKTIDAHTLKKAAAHLEKFAQNEHDKKVGALLQSVHKKLLKAHKNSKDLTKEDLKLTLELIHNAIGSMAVDYGQKKSHRPDCIKLLKEIKKELCHCCKHLKHQLNEIEKLIDKKFGCTVPKEIKEVPVVINTDGKWCVKKDLIFSGTGAAINIAANNVSLNFANHSLTLTDPTAQAILAESVSEITIENDIIKSTVASTDPNSVAISLINTDKVTLNNIFTANTNQGVKAVDCTDLKIVGSHFENHAGNSGANAVLIEGGSNFIFDQCVFKDNFFDPASHGIFLRFSPITRNIPQNASVRNCQFFNTPFIIANVAGFLYENNTSVVTDPNNAVNFLQLGSPVFSSTIAFDAIVRNSTFTNQNANAEFDGVALARTNGVLIDNIIVDSNPTGDSGNPTAANIHAVAESHNVIIRNSIIKNSPNIGIMFEGINSGITIDNCLVEEGLNANIRFDGVTASTIENSKVQRGGNVGIELNGCSSVAILGNVVNDNNGNGIQLDAASTVNNVQFNKVFKNGGVGINNLGGATNQIYNNTSCGNNGAFDCVGIVPATLAGAPGSVPTLGENICCTHTP